MHGTWVTSSEPSTASWRAPTSTSPRPPARCSRRERLKASPALADIPSIMMSGDSRVETPVRSMEAGATAFVVKPFTRQSLTLKLEKVLKG
jgi:PleD family two-component response regulator